MTTRLSFQIKELQFERKKKSVKINLFFKVTASQASILTQNLSVSNLRTCIFNLRMTIFNLQMTVQCLSIIFHVKAQIVFFFFFSVFLIWLVRVNK